MIVELGEAFVPSLLPWAVTGKDRSLSPGRRQTDGWTGHAVSLGSPHGGEGAGRGISGWPVTVCRD